MLASLINCNVRLICYESDSVIGVVPVIKLNHP